MCQQPFARRVRSNQSGKVENENSESKFLSTFIDHGINSQLVHRSWN